MVGEIKTVAYVALHIKIISLSGLRCIWPGRGDKDLFLLLYPVPSVFKSELPPSFYLLHSANSEETPKHDLCSKLHQGVRNHEGKGGMHLC